MSLVQKEKNIFSLSEFDVAQKIVLKLIKLGNLILGDYMKRKIRAGLLILFFLVIYVYVCNVTLIPSNIIVFQGENVDFKTLYGIKVNPRSAVYSSYNAMQASSNLSEKISDNVGTVNLTLDLFGTIPIKQIDVSVLPRTTVVPLGNSVGLK